MQRLYRCACCDGEFLTGRSDEEATAEALQRFGPEALAAGPVETVCNDCAQLIYQWLDELKARAH